MRKRSMALLVVMLFALFGSMTVNAVSAASFIDDEAQLLSASERSELALRAEDLSYRFDCDIQIVTVPDMRDYGFSRIDALAYDIYTERELGYGPDRDCVFFILSMADRDYDLRVWGGFANAAFTLYGIDDILDNYILPALRVNDYNRAFTLFLDRAEVYFEMAVNGNPFDRSTDTSGAPDASGASESSSDSSLLGTIAVSFLIALGIAMCICIFWRSQMKTAKIARTADNYIPAGGFRLKEQGDIYLYRTISRVRIQQTSSSTSGGGGAARSGGFGGSSGRSGKF